MPHTLLEYKYQKLCLAATKLECLCSTCDRSQSWSTRETSLACWSATRCRAPSHLIGWCRCACTLTPRTQMSCSSCPFRWPTPSSTMALNTWVSRTSLCRHRWQTGVTSAWRRPSKPGWADHLLVCCALGAQSHNVAFVWNLKMSCDDNFPEWFWFLTCSVRGWVQFDLVACVWCMLPLSYDQKNYTVVQGTLTVALILYGCQRFSVI